MPAARPPHPNLINYCSTEAQAEKIRLWLKHGSAEKAAADLGIDTSNIHHTLTRVKKQAKKSSYQGPWYADEDESFEDLTVRIVEYETLTVTEEHKLKRQIKVLTAENKQLEQRLTESEDVLNLLDQTEDFEFKAPTKKRRKAAKKKK